MLKKVIVLVSGATLLVLGFVFSVVLLAIVALIGLTIWSNLWWKQRKFRHQMRPQAGDADFIDGEATVIDEQFVEVEYVLPGDSPGQ